MRTRFKILPVFLISQLISQFCTPIRIAAQQSTPPAKVARPSTAIFKEMSDHVGLKFQHYNGMTGKLYLPEIMGSGAALFDFDNDGDLDVFLDQGNVLEPNTRPTTTQFPWRGPESPRGRQFRNDHVLRRPEPVS